MKSIFTLIFAFTIFTTSGQDFTNYLKENAVRINKADSLDDSIYKLLSGFKLIMVGEMHGTNEPAKFVIGLTQLLANKGDSILIGLEIPSGEMTKFLNEHSDTSIYSSDFFSKKAIDGRESVAWAEIISMLNKNKNVKLFFFDVNKGDYEISRNRDSLMYIKIKEKIQQYPGWKTITLSGNVHNMLQPFKDNNTIAFYLKTDGGLNISDKMCSINHRYNSGTMYNDMGKGLELRQIKSLNSVYYSSVNYENYLFLFPESEIGDYNGIYFTRYVTAAKMVSY